MNPYLHTLTPLQKAFTYTFLKLVNSAHLPALRTLILKGTCLDAEAREAVLAALPLPKLGNEKTKGHRQAAAMAQNLSSSHS